MNSCKELHPIFIVGNSRSGTTLMGRILGSHPEVFTFDELHFFEELWNPDDGLTEISPEEASYLFARLLSIQRNGYLTQGKIADFLSESESIVQSLPKPLFPPSIFAAFLKYETQCYGKTRPCEQTPQNILYIGEILQEFPNARIIHMIRDPRDILLSQKKRWKRPFLSDNIPKKESIRYWSNYHPITISKLWNGNISSAKQFTQDSRIQEIRFEDLVSNPTKTVTEICHFLNLSYTDNLLKVPQIGSSNTRDSAEKIGIDKTKAQNWSNGELTDTEIFWCQQINHLLMTQYSYPLKSVSPHLASVVFSLVNFPLKVALAILLSLKRVRNLKSAIIRRLK